MPESGARVHSPVHFCLADIVCLVDWQVYEMCRGRRVDATFNTGADPMIQAMISKSNVSEKEPKSKYRYGGT